MKEKKYTEIQNKAKLSGGQAQIDKQHAKGKLTARERIEKLLDLGTFVETGLHVSHRSVGFGLESKRFATDGVVTGWGDVDGQRIYVFAQDFTILGGSLGEAHGLKIARIMDLAYQNGRPIVGLNDSGGARIQEGVDSLAAYGEIFYRNTRASGIIPQISLIMGPCAGGAVYSPGINDFVFMLEQNAFMFITGPEVIKTVTHEDVTFSTLGGASVHSEKSGVAHFTAPDEEAMFNQLRWLLSYLPPNNLTSPPFLSSDDDPRRLTPELDSLVPDEPTMDHWGGELLGFPFPQPSRAAAVLLVLPAWLRFLVARGLATETEATAALAFLRPLAQTASRVLANNEVPSDILADLRRRWGQPVGP